jgi:hypothetical protein
VVLHNTRQTVGRTGQCCACLLSLPENYTEYLTDADYQTYRDKVLGLSDRFDNLKDWADAQDPTILKEWYDSLPSYQKQEYDAGTLPVPTLDFIPDRLRDKIVMDKGTTFLEGKLSTVLGEKEQQQQKMFGALTNDSLKQAAFQLQQSKLKEQEFDFYSGLPGFNEVMTVNESIANSILGDTGVGGIFGWMGDTGKTTGEPREKPMLLSNWQYQAAVTLFTTGKDGLTRNCSSDTRVGWKSLINLTKMSSITLMQNLRRTILIAT